jgi:hypothetical protein
MKGWTDLTAEEQATFGNGCGAGIFKWVPELLFNACCRQHDYYYWRGGDVFNKFEADVMFYAHMVKSVNSNYDRWFKKIPLFVVATGYFLAVALFGVFAFTWR